VCIDYDGFAKAFARPCVFKEDGVYKMFYSYRSVENYRSDPMQGYRLGYAESSDGVHWIREKLGNICCTMAMALVDQVLVMRFWKKQRWKNEPKLCVNHVIG